MSISAEVKIIFVSAAIFLIAGMIKGNDCMASAGVILLALCGMEVRLATLISEQQGVKS